MKLRVWHLLAFSLALWALIIGATVQAFAWTHGTATGTTYYMSPTGSDGASGLTPATAWLSPNHAVNCGDTIIAAAGAYSATNFAGGKWGTVSSCPSSNGLYFAKVYCDGPYVTSCSISSSTAAAMFVTKSNWAVVGWTATTSAADGGCFMAAPVTAATIHHIAFVNVIANGCLANGVTTFTNNSGSPQYGVDYFAAVGVIAYNASQGSDFCYSGVSVYEPANSDVLSGTHIYVAGVFSIANIAPAGCASGLNSDGNGVIFDDWSHSQQAGSAYTGQGVIEQSMMFGNGAAGVAILNNTAGVVYVFTTTAYGDYSSPDHLGTYNGELIFTGSTSTTVASGNLFQASRQTQNGNAVYACYVGLSDADAVVDANYCFGVGGNNTAKDSSPSFSFGTNTAATPDFVNPTVPGAPSCSGFATTTACMATVRANFVAQAGGASGKGYQSPGACAPNAYFPTWMKGMIPEGIITKPCGY